MAKKPTKTEQTHGPVIVLVRDTDQPDLYRRKNSIVMTVDAVTELAKTANVWIFYKPPSGGSGYARFGKPGTVGDFGTV